MNLGFQSKYHLDGWIYLPLLLMFRLIEIEDVDELEDPEALINL
jgi:hypothetical protein